MGRQTRGGGAGGLQPCPGPTASCRGVSTSGPVSRLLGSLLWQQPREARQVGDAPVSVPSPAPLASCSSFYAATLLGPEPGRSLPRRCPTARPRPPLATAGLQSDGRAPGPSFPQLLSL